MAQTLGGQPLGDVLNAPCNDDDARVLRGHVHEAHPNLFDSAGGPLPTSDLSAVPNSVLASIHTANHAGQWRPHQVDHWGPPKGDTEAS